MFDVILYHIYSGHLFFTAAGLYLIGVASRRLRVLALLAIPLAMFSGTPMPLWFAVPLIAVTITALIGDRSLILRTVAAAGVVTAALAELPYQMMPAIPEAKRVIVIGDSLAAGGFAETRPWPERLGVPAVNLGRASATAQDGLADQIPQMPPPLPGDVVIVEIGGNDMLERLGVAPFETALDAIVRAAAPRDVVLLELPLLPGRWAYGASQRRIAHRRGVPLIPKRVLAAVLTDDRNTDDGLHLTDRGHGELAARIRRAPRLRRQ